MYCDHEVETGQNGRKARNKDRQPGFNYLRVAEQAGIRGVEGPARVHAAGEDAVQVQNAGDDVNVPAQQVNAWKRQVLRPDHDRDKKVPQHGRNRRD